MSVTRKNFSLLTKINRFLSDPYMHAVGFSHLHDVDYYPPVKAHPLEKKWAYSYLLGGNEMQFLKFAR